MSTVSPTNWSLYKRAWPYMKPWWWLYGLAMLCAPASAVLTIVQPALLRTAIDDHIRGSEYWTRTGSVSTNKLVLQ